MPDIKLPASMAMLRITTCHNSPIFGLSFSDSDDVTPPFAVTHYHSLFSTLFSLSNNSVLLCEKKRKKNVVLYDLDGGFTARDASRTCGQVF